MKKEFDEFVNLIQKNYYWHNLDFKNRLLDALKEKTQNNNIGILCAYVIDNIIKFNCDKIVTNPKNNNVNNPRIIN